MAQSAVDEVLERQPVRPGTFSERLWNLDWRVVLDLVIDDDVHVEHGTFDDALPFIHANYAEIFGTDDGRFVAESMTPAKRRFCNEMDVFLFRSKSAECAKPSERGIVGLIAGHPSDWSTYYLRTAAIKEEFRERRLGSILLARLAEVLRDVGVGRMEMETSPTNIPVVRAHLSLGYVMTGTANTERWGTLARFTKFLDDELAATFARQFCLLDSKRRSQERSAP